MRVSGAARVLLLAMALALAAGGVAAAERWALVPEDSRLLFRPTWKGQPFEGEFRRFDATLVLAPEDPAASRLHVEVDVTSADAGGEDLNEGMASREWLAFERYPTAVYEAGTIRRLEPGRYEAEGTLRLKGRERSLTLPFDWDAQGDRARLRAEIDVDRGRWRVGQGQWSDGDAIGLEVTVVVDAVFRRAPEAGDE